MLFLLRVGEGGSHRGRGAKMEGGERVAQGEGVRMGDIRMLLQSCRAWTIVQKMHGLRSEAVVAERRGTKCGCEGGGGQGACSVGTGPGKGKARARGRCRTNGGKARRDLLTGTGSPERTQSRLDLR